MRLGLLGGTFDPIHLGHLIVAEAVRTGMGFDSVCFIPAGRPRLRRPPIASGRHRLAMVQLAVESNPLFSVSTVEIERPGETYTVDTLEELRQGTASADDLFFIMGVDSLRAFHLWREPGRILELATVVVVKRPGYSATVPDELRSLVPDAAARLLWASAPQIEISGVELRRRVAQGLSIRYLVPEKVAQYIEAHALYQTPVAAE